MLFGITSENLIGFGLITLKNTVEPQHHLLKDLVSLCMFLTLSGLEKIQNKFRTNTSLKKNSSNK